MTGRGLRQQPPRRRLPNTDMHRRGGPTDRRRDRTADRLRGTGTNADHLPGGGRHAAVRPPPSGVPGRGRNTPSRRHLYRDIPTPRAATATGEHREQPALLEEKKLNLSKYLLRC